MHGGDRSVKFIQIESQTHAGEGQKLYSAYFTYTIIRYTYIQYVSGKTKQQNKLY